VTEDGLAQADQSVSARDDPFSDAVIADAYIAGDPATDPAN